MVLSYHWRVHKPYIFASDDSS